MPAPAATAPTEAYAYAPADFERVRALIHRHAGIALNATKRALVYSRLSRRLRVTGHADFTAYLDALEHGPPDAPEWQEFVNALTTNLTSFFREAHHFPILADHLRRPRAARPQRIWCAAASTGEEPYSIAITALEALGTTGAFELLATDIDTRVLATARAGIYPHEAAARMDSARLHRHFQRGSGANAGLVRVRDTLRERISFRPLNLLAPRWPMDTRFDAIFCRNVMIYFDRPTQQAVLRRLAAHLAPDGLLFAGHSENFAHSADILRLEGKTVYRLARA